MKLNYKTVIGVGQTGSRLANQYSNKKDLVLTFNTDHRDSVGINKAHDKLITNGGAGQNYASGLKIWASNRDELEKYLEPVENQDVVYFVSGGGGSGSSSVVTFLNILMKQNNRILLVVALPFIKESIPATANATRLLNRVSEFSNNMSVYVVSNDDIAKKVGKSMEKINKEIINKTRMITDIPYIHNESKFTPYAIDEGDHRSVAYSGGFINLSYDDPEEEYYVTEKIKNPKFSYGKLQEANNILITKLVHSKFSDKDTMKEGDALIDVSLKLGSVAKGARVIHGIVRTDSKNSPKYVIIASGLNIDKVFNKLKAKATGSAIKHIDKIKTKATKKLEAKEDRLLNV